MLILLGTSSISQPKRDTLLLHIQKRVPAITSVDANWVHFIKCTTEQLEKELADENSLKRNTLDQLLTYGDSHHCPTREYSSQGKIVIYVLPRYHLGRARQQILLVYVVLGDMLTDLNVVSLTFSLSPTMMTIDPPSLTKSYRHLLI